MGIVIEDSSASLGIVLRQTRMRRKWPHSRTRLPLPRARAKEKVRGRARKAKEKEIALLHIPYKYNVRTLRPEIAHMEPSVNSCILDTVGRVVVTRHKEDLLSFIILLRLRRQPTSDATDS